MRSAGQEKAPLTREAAAALSQRKDLSDAEAREALMHELESLPPELKG
jgi:hypothetical protein